ncbi:MAG: type IX secretion system outer membrane channel protein PorV [Bacteroidales bacterium]|nr:type IX secretion system outer membrane channel protein PorV [Bacteroidales bacterium]
MQVKSILTIVLAMMLSFEGMAQSATGQDQKSNPITTAVPFLLLCPDSRMGGMGETGVAVLNDGNAQHWNQSKYVFSENKGGFSASYSPWLQGLNVKGIALAYMSAYGKIGDRHAVSGSLRFFSMGEMTLTDNFGNNIKTDKPFEMALDFGYTLRLIDNLSMGVTGRFIASKLASWSSDNSIRPGYAGAVDVSLFYTKEFRSHKLKESRLNFGLSISNIGNKVSYTKNEDRLTRNFLPANFRAGIAYTMKIDEYNKLTFAFDLNKLLVPTNPTYARDSTGALIQKPGGETGEYEIEKGKDPYEINAAGAVFVSWFDAPGGFVEEMKEFIENFGIEYSYNNLLFIRTGFFNEAKTKGNRKYMTFGVGIKYSIFTIDAAYILPVSGRNHPLENTVRFTVSFDFGAANTKKLSAN